VAKRLELMRELVPAATAIGLLVNPKNPNAESDTRDVETAARALGLKIHVANASSESEFAPAFSNFVGQRVGAMLMLPIRSFSADATRSRHSRPATPFPRCTTAARSPPLAG
jgi:putative tryptophan/tyrosine transport system substrate-binding protein